MALEKNHLKQTTLLKSVERWKHLIWRLVALVTSTSRRPGFDVMINFSVKKSAFFLYINRCYDPIFAKMSTFLTKTRQLCFDTLLGENIFLNHSIDTIDDM
jgi:hypothetical protein